MLDSATQPAADYAAVKSAIEFMSTRWRDQPAIEEIAEHVGLSASHFQHLFKRWAGLTPKAFLQAITIERARELLRDSASVLDAAFDVGLSGPGRLHDLFVTHECLTPGDYRRDDLTQVNTNRLTTRDGEHGVFLNLALQQIEARVAGNRRAAEIGVERDQRLDGVGKHLFRDAAHFRNLAAEQLQIAIECPDCMVRHFFELPAASRSGR